MKKSILLFVALTLLILPAWAFAKPQVSFSITAEKEVTIDKVTKRVPAESFPPGAIVFYTMNYVNSGDEAATDVVLDDPIPKGMVYIPGSAFGDHAEISFSVDGGKTFKKPSLLTYEVKTSDGKIDKRTASPEQYTHIRWTVKSVSAGGKGQVGFQVRVK